MILVTLNVTYVYSGLGYLFRIRSINLILEYKYIRMAYNFMFFFFFYHSYYISESVNQNNYNNKSNGRRFR